MRLNQKLLQNKQKITKIGKYTEIPFLRQNSNKNYISERYSISEAFKTFTWKIIPTLEERIEERIIGNLYDKMESETLRNELLLAYQRRRMNIDRANFDSDTDAVESDFEEKTPHEFIDVYFNNPDHSSTNSIGNFFF